MRRYTQPWKIWTNCGRINMFAVEYDFQEEGYGFDYGS